MCAAILFHSILSYKLMVRVTGSLDPLFKDCVDIDDLYLVAQPCLEPHGHGVTVLTPNTYDPEPVMAVREIFQLIEKAQCLLLLSEAVNTFLQLVTCNIVDEDNLSAEGPLRAIMIA